MSHYRLNLFIQPEHAKRLDELAAKKGVSKSSIVAAALASWLSPDAADQREAAIAKRLDRLSRQAERMERDQNIQIETLALFIRYYLTVSTPVPEAHQEAARAQGKARFEQFVEQLGHLAIAQGQAAPGRDPQEVVAAHVRRLEALRRTGIVERVAEGLWKVPDDLPEQGRQYDAQRLGGVAVELKSHLPIERQARVIGVTWLDQQLIGGGSGLGDLGFGGEAKQAMQQRADFLAEQGLAERRGQRVILARNLLGTLRSRELAQAAKDIAAETGLEHRPVADGQRVAGIYRRSLMLASGRYAMLDDGMGFSLVPWRPVIEQRLGQPLAATVRGGTTSWEIGRRLGVSLG